MKKCVNITSHLKLKEIFTETFKLLKYDLFHTLIYDWFNRFKCGYESNENCKMVA